MLAAKVFKLAEKIGMDTIAAKLKDFKREEEYDDGQRRLKLFTEIGDLELKGKTLKGLLVRDRVLHVSHRGNVVPVPKTLETPFAFTPHGGGVALTVLERKLEANSVANLLSEILFAEPGRILEARISPDTLRRYHEENPGGTKVIFFDQLDIPNVEKLALYGPDILNTQLYGEYLNHGTIWYIVVTSRRQKRVVGITRNGIVTMFNRVSPSELLEYIEEEIFPLIS